MSMLRAERQRARAAEDDDDRERRVQCSSKQDGISERAERGWHALCKNGNGVSGQRARDSDARMGMATDKPHACMHVLPWRQVDQAPGHPVPVNSIHLGLLFYSIF